MRPWTGRGQRPRGSRDSARGRAQAVGARGVRRDGRGVAGAGSTAGVAVAALLVRLFLILCSRRAARSREPESAPARAGAPACAGGRSRGAASGAALPAPGVNGCAAAGRVNEARRRGRRRRRWRRCGDWDAPWSPAACSPGPAGDAATPAAAAASYVVPARRAGRPRRGQGRGRTGGARGASYSKSPGWSIQTADLFVILVQHSPPPRPLQGSASHISILERNEGVYSEASKVVLLQTMSKGESVDLGVHGWS